MENHENKYKKLLKNWKRNKKLKKWKTQKKEKRKKWENFKNDNFLEIINENVKILKKSEKQN